MSAPLSAFTVLEVAGPGAHDMHHLALGLAGRLAGDLGATVVRVVPEAGDPFERMPVLPWEVGHEPAALATTLNASKTLIAADVADTALLEALASRADAVLTTGEFLVDPDWTRVTVRLATLPDGHPLGPADDPPIGELGVLALSGLLDIVGDPDREPLALGGHQAAYAAGFAVFSALMTGLAGRSAHGVGDALDVDMLDVLVWINWKGVAAEAFGQVTPATRQGDRAEWGIVRAADGWIALVFNERDWPQLVALVGHPALADPELATGAGRARHRSGYMAHITAWAATRTREEIYRAAQQLRIPIGPVVEVSEMPADPQVEARGSLGEVPAAGDRPAMTVPLVPVAWNGSRFCPSAPVSVHASEWLRSAKVRPHGD